MRNKSRFCFNHLNPDGSKIFIEDKVECQLRTWLKRTLKGVKWK